MPSLHLFCRVIDNFGDIGVCWRLARQVANEHQFEVTLWVDDLPSFKRLCRAVDPALDLQQIEAVCVRRWSDPFPDIPPQQIPDIVIEGFGCRLPEEYLHAMAARPVKPAWINLEYLSAEAWVDSCHGLPSPHPGLPLTKHFYFPGFTAQAGGLLREHGLEQRRAAFDADPTEADAFLSQIGVSRAGHERILTLFCYPQAPVADLFSLLQGERSSTLCLVAEGVASDAVRAFLGTSAVAGMRVTKGGLTVQVVPFLEQPDYDLLLWCADLNFVRGEDSFVRGQWAERPLLWHIYPQEEGAHLVKLDAFLERYCSGLPENLGTALANVMRGWNGAGIAADDWRQIWSPAAAASLRQHARSWAGQLRVHGDLASNLLRFAKESC
ncbi:elongation factor P maturation arginine rhamnosyltransferase EarP [Lacisediminimonas profundi]|uniref:elongation factor P maturation arginine rhamnosyltransferase EarP n=1 Tax=Lacisediminimonas profundi TaxID=2603856 RepID=UPI00124B7DD6|nr:elongation factor P maturation arginine rhamnosyltransferase EarP [Lacisediminimonas profundi]